MDARKAKPGNAFLLFVVYAWALNASMQDAGCSLFAAYTRTLVSLYVTVRGRLGILTILSHVGMSDPVENQKRVAYSAQFFVFYVPRSAGHWN